MTFPRIHFTERLPVGALSRLVETMPRARDLIQSLRRRYNMTEERARVVVERLLGRLLNDFGAVYTSDMIARLDRIMSLRDQLERVYRSVGEGQPLPDGLTPRDVEALFNRLDSEMRMLQSAGEYAQGDGLTRLADAEPDVLPEPTAATLPTLPPVPPRPTLAQTLFGQIDALARLDAPVREAITQLADRAPDLVRRVVGSEDETAMRTNLLQLIEFMRREGTSPEEIARVSEGMTELNIASNRERRRRDPRPPVGPDLPPERLRDEATNLFNERVREPSRRRAAERDFAPTAEESALLDAAANGDFLAAVRNSPELSRSMLENPGQLARWWREYNEGGRWGSFHDYVTAYDLNTPEGRLRTEAIQNFQQYAQGVVARQQMDRNFRPPGNPRNARTPQEQAVWRNYEENLAVAQAYWSPEFFQHLRNNHELARMAHENPVRLALEWRDYVAARNAGRDVASFGAFVSGRRMRVTERGRVGEFIAQFGLGENIAMLRQADENVHAEGIDLISLNRQTDEILIIDNKAHVQPRSRLPYPSVESVTSLVENLVVNMEREVRTLRERIREVTNADPSLLNDSGMIDVVRAANRLDLALNQVRALLATTTLPISDAGLQLQITGILQTNGIRRVVTTAAGRTDARLSSTLQSYGIGFIDMATLPPR